MKKLISYLLIIAILFTSVVVFAQMVPSDPDRTVPPNDNAKSEGTYIYSESDIDKDANGYVNEKKIRNHTGKVDQRQGLLFEYNAADKTDQQVIQGAGISFNATGTDEFWKPDINTRELKKQSSQFSQKNFSGIGAGNKGDKVTKIKNGFIIDFKQSKDTTYNDSQGSHIIKSLVEYHAELTRVNRKIK